MLIDSHVHVGPWEYFNGLDKVMTNFSEIVAALVDRGFYGAVLMPSEVKENDELLLEIKKYRDSGGTFKIWFFPWLNPKKQLDRVFLEQNTSEIDGVKFHPSLDKLPLTLGTHGSFLELCKENSWPVIVHCGGWQEVAGYHFVLEAASRMPEVNFICAHQGGNTYELKGSATIDVANAQLDNVYLDISGTHENWLIEHAVEKVGAEKLLLGSDFPIREAAIYPALIKTAKLTEHQKDQICSKNILGILNKSV